jgi:hypothetical protein
MLRSIALFIANGLIATGKALQSIRTWPRKKIVGVTCLGPFIAVILSYFNHPLLAVLAFATGVAFFHIATASSVPPSNEE